MGRQLVVAFTDEQERAFLACIRESRNVRLLHCNPVSPDALEVKHFAPRGDWNWFYYLATADFPWTAALDKAPGADPQIRYRVSNAAGAPLIEYIRHNFSGNEPVGRLYWANDFATPSGLAYDIKEFGAWFDAVVKCAKKCRGAP